MRQRLDMDRIARDLGGKRRGAIKARGGYFGAEQLLAELERRFRVPPSGGRRTDPTWTERRLLPLAPQTLTRLEELARRIKQRRGITITPMQLAALLLERTAQGAGTGIEELIEEKEAAAVRRRRRGTG